jgi:hypothetical protein
VGPEVALFEDMRGWIGSRIALVTVRWYDQVCRGLTGMVKWQLPKLNLKFLGETPIRCQGAHHAIFEAF